MKNTIEGIQKWIGKRVLVIDSKNVKIGGILEYVGYNENFPSWGIQVTIGRLPITNVDLDNVSLIEEPLPMSKKKESD